MAGASSGSLMHFGNDLQINDAGYLSRNSTNYVHWQVNRRFTDLPAESRYASKDWRWRVSTDYNDHGELLGHQFRISRESRLRNGSYEYGADQHQQRRRRTICSRAATAR